MKKTYQSVMTLLALDALESDKDNGCYFVEAMMDSLEEKSAEALANIDALAEKTTALEEAQKELETLKATLAEKEASLAEATEKITVVEQALVEKGEALEEANKSIEALNAEKEALNATIAEKDATLAEKETALTEKDNLLASKDAEIAELAQKTTPAPAAPAPQATEQPVNNEFKGFNPSASLEENRKAMAAAIK